MNAPDHDPFAYDDRLRAHFEEAARTPPAPPAHVWQQLRSQLPSSPLAPPAPRQSPLLAGLGGLVLGILLTALLGWRLVGPPTTTAGSAAHPIATNALPTTTNALPTTTNALPTTTNALPIKSNAQPIATNASPITSNVSPIATNASPITSNVSPITTVAQPTVSTSGVAGTSDSTSRLQQPATVAVAPAGPAVPAILLTLVQTENSLAPLRSDTAATACVSRRAVLLTQRAELIRLRHRTDSLLLVCGETGEATAVVDPVLPAPLQNRWSVALAFAPERNFFGLAAPATDTLSTLRRTHEQGRSGYNAALLAEYRLNDRLSVASGLGMSSYGAELRLTDHHTTVSTKLDSTLTTSTQINNVTTRAFAIRTWQDSISSPILNFNNEVIGYEYLPITRHDTVWTNITTTDVTTHTTTTYTPTITTRQEVSARILKPNYRFLTVPVLLRYRLGRATDWTASPNAPRWWADVAVGAQLQLFLGGTQATTRDGLTYQTERVGARGGPFRPVNLALTGAVALNYALTPRLSASLAPTLRYQVESVYKASTNLTQRPTATGLQLGLKYAF